MALESKGATPSCKPLGSPWTKALEAHQCKTIQGKRRTHKKLMSMKGKQSAMKSRRVLMKRRPQRAPRRVGKDHGFETRVWTLKRMIPNRKSKGLEGLFRDTADYIMALEMRVKVMQLMVDALTGCSSQSHE